MTLTTLRRHGTSYGYKIGCRCDACREARRIEHREWRDRARAENRPSYQRDLERSRALKDKYRGTCQDCGASTTWSDSERPIRRCIPCHREHVAAQHGTRSKYHAGCRCDDCRAAATAAMREWRRRRKAAA